MTEPLDHDKEFLKELESKVLDKYQEELDEIEEWKDPSTFKLKAHQTKDLFRAFHDSLGSQISKSEDTDMNMIGNLDDFVETFNQMQETYILNKGSNDISVKPFDQTMKNDDEDDTPAPKKLKK